MVAGISETLAKEVAGFDIKVTASAPGSFRTDWASRSMVRSERSISDNDAMFDPARNAHREKSGKQTGDSARAARVLLQIFATDDPPLQLLLGTDALELVGEKLDAHRAEIAAWEALSRSTDFISSNGS